MSVDGKKQKFCRGLKKIAFQRIPILKWLPEYNSEKLLSDMIAGITVGLTVMPQGLAYATLAGLEPQVRVLLRYFYLITLGTTKPPHTLHVLKT